MYDIVHNIHAYIYTCMHACMHLGKLLQRHHCDMAGLAGKTRLIVLSPRTHHCTHSHNILLGHCVLFKTVDRKSYTLFK